MRRDLAELVALARQTAKALGGSKPGGEVSHEATSRGSGGLAKRKRLQFRKGQATGGGR